MIQILFYVLIAETALILLLLLKNPFKKFGLMGLDRVKRGKGPIIMKTIAATIFMVLVSSLYSIAKIQKRTFDVGTVTPTDEVLMGKHLLEASFMGFTLLLALIIDRAHLYLRELRTLRKNAEAAKKQNRGFEDGKNGSSDGAKELEGEISNLKLKIKQLESELAKKEKDTTKKHDAELDEEVANQKKKIKELESELGKKDKEAKAAEADALALRKQSEGLLLEYDRLLEDNQNLRSQLLSMEWSASHSDGKKNT